MLFRSNGCLWGSRHNPCAAHRGLCSGSRDHSGLCFLQRHCLHCGFGECYDNKLGKNGLFPDTRSWKFIDVNGRNDASSVTVAFISGQAAALACPGTAVMTGPQPVSDFIITVVPPLGMRETGTAALPVTTGAAPVLPATSSTKAGSLFPAGAAGAAGLVLLARARKRR